MAARQDQPQLGSNSPARPGDPIDLETSVAGEEDPGASLDMPPGKDNAARPGQPARPSGGPQAETPSIDRNKGA